MSDDNDLFDLCCSKLALPLLQKGIHYRIMWCLPSAVYDCNRGLRERYYN